MSADPVVRAIDVRRSYAEGAGTRHALAGVDLSVSAGELVAVVGASGSGKSTLLHLLGGLDTASGGSIDVAGEVVTDMTEAQRTRFRREHIGFVFQAYHLVPSMTVAENVALAAVVTGSRPRSWRTRAVELLGSLGLADRADGFPGTMSGGERQRVAVARALFASPDVVLADEPTGNLDSVAGEVVLGLLRAAVDTGASRCGVVVTHDAAVAGVADRVVALHDGRVVDDLMLAEPGTATTREKGDHDVERVRAWLAAAAR